MSTRGVGWRLYADASGVRRGARDAEQELTRLNRVGSAAMTGLKVGALGAGVAVGTTLVAGIRTGWQEMLEAQKVGAQTETVLKNIGRQSGVTAGQVEGLASKYQALTGYEDDAIQSAENVLLTMGKLSSKALPDATKATLDLARRFDMDLGSAARLVGKALADPEKGVTALQRRLGPLDADTRKSIASLMDHGKTAQAQALILGALEKRVGGSAEAYGRTLPGAIDRGKRAFEDMSERVVVATIKAWPRIQAVINDFAAWFRANVMPNIRASIQNLTRFWNEHRDDIKLAVRVITTSIRTIATIVTGTVRVVTALLAGDWSQAWKAAKQTVVNALNQIVPALRALGSRLLEAAKSAGQAIGRGILAGLRAILPMAVQRFIGLADNSALVDDVRTRFRIPQAGSASSSGSATGQRAGQTRAAGGVIPGQRGAGDSVPVVARPGEAFLTEPMISDLGWGRVMGVIARHGGVLGGGRFAAGGVASAIGAAYRFASAQVGEPYVWGGGHEGVVERRGWDCSGFASNVAARIRGYRGGIGTTMSLYPASTPARGGEPVVFGFRGMGRGPRGEHMGIRINGQWFDAGSGGVEKGDSRWDSLRVPPGLEYLSGLGGGGDMKAAAQGGGRASGGGGMTAGQARRVSRALMRGGGRTPGGLTDIASIDDRHADDSLEERGMRAQKVPESQILMHRKSELEADASDIRQRIARLQTRYVQLKNRRQTLRNEMVKRSTKPARRAAIRGLLVDLNDEMTQVADAIYSLDQELRNVMRQQAELGFDITDAQAAEAEAAAAPATDTGAAQEYQGPSYTEILNANTNALNGEWWRTAMGSGDIGTGGPTALAAAGGGRWVTIRVDSGSLAGAVATAAGDQGAIPATIVPSGA